MTNFIFRLKNVSTVVADFALKRVAIIAIALIFSFTVAAQSQGDFAVGANPLLFGVLDNDISSFGVGPKVQFNVTDKIRLSGEMSFSVGWISDVQKRALIDNSSIGFQDYSVYVHYLFSLSNADQTEHYFLYPLVGIGVWNYKSEITTRIGPWTSTVSDSGSNTAFTIGVGGSVPIGRWALDTEMKFKFHSDFGGFHFIMGIGVTYKL